MSDSFLSMGQILQRRFVSAPYPKSRSVPITILIMMLLGGCLRTERPISPADLKNPDPMVRIRAIKLAGENKNTKAVPKLLELSQNEDQAVRFYAVMALRNITQTDPGFDYQADARRRAEAVNYWKKRFVIIDATAKSPKNAAKTTATLQN